VSADGSFSARCTFLHSQDVFAAHAVDSITILEAAVRITARTAIWSQPPVVTKVPGLAAVAVMLARQADPGSAEVQHCHSFLASLLKLGAHPAVRSNPRFAGLVCEEAALRALELLAPDGLIGVGQQMQPTAAVVVQQQEQQQASWQDQEQQQQQEQPAPAAVGA
jgi:hypothetical protein